MESLYKRDRLYLLDTGTATDFNTYKYYPTCNIPHEPLGDKDNYIKGVDDQMMPGVLSLFNYTQSVIGEANIREAVNAPLLDTPDKKKRLREQQDCSIKSLVKASELGTLGRATYDYSNFMYCKHLGKVSNNYLITLRRFAYPVGDHINHNNPNFDSASPTALNNSGEFYAAQGGPPDIGRLVTWLGVSDNKMENILTYDFNMSWEKQKAKWQDMSDLDADGTAGSSFLGKLLNSTDPNNASYMMNGQSTSVMSGMVDWGIGQGSGYTGGILGGLFSDKSERPYEPGKFAPWKDEHKPYGPINVINETYYQQGSAEGGLKFNHSIKLVFEYELRSYDGINPRAAMIDLLGNILTVAHTTGDFWGGGFKSCGAHASNTYTNLPLFQKAGNGTLTPENFIDTTVDSFTSVLSSITGGADDWRSALANIGKAAFGGGIGALLNKMGRPQKKFISALLKPDPTGFWHVMIGNPKHPILSMGNMVLTKCTVTHTGLLGYDDFPTGLRIEVQLEHGKPRSNREIEMMYLNGDSRIYFPLSTEYKQIYDKAKQYKTTNVSNITTAGDATAQTEDLNMLANTISLRHYVRNTGVRWNDDKMMQYNLIKPEESKKEKTTASNSNATGNNNKRTNVQAAAAKNNKK